MGPKISLSGDFDALAKTELVPEAWYIGFDCRSCGKPIAILEDPTGAGTVVVDGDGRLSVSCPACGRVEIYRASDARVFRGGETNGKDESMTSDPDVEGWLEAWAEAHAAANAQATSKSDMRTAAQTCVAEARDCGITIAELKSAAGGDLEAFLLSRRGTGASG